MAVKHVLGGTLAFLLATAVPGFAKESGALPTAFTRQAPLISVIAPSKDLEEGIKVEERIKAIKTFAKDWSESRESILKLL